MIDYKYFHLFQQGSVDKQWKIKYSGGLITNKELFNQSIELVEALCSEPELRFGSCEACYLKFKVANILTPLIGKKLTVSVVVNHKDDAPLQVGEYKVFSDKPTADRKWREIIAYDAMYDIIGADVSTWYNTILPDKNSTVTLKQFRESFIQHFKLEEVVPKGGLVNDDMTVEKTIEPEQLSGKTVITAICEINGCFGHIGRDGKFHYIYLPQAIQGLYPANDLFPDHAPDYLPDQQKTGHLYPQDPKGIRIGKENYITAHYEDFRTQSITMLQIRQEENDIGVIYPDREIAEDDNCYIIQDNFLVYGKTHEQLTEIARNIYGKMIGVSYRPFDADCRGNPCFEVGDPVRLSTKYELIESYILQRTLKGIQALRDDYSANGVEKYAEKVNGVQNSIIQVKGITSKLLRTVDKVWLEMKNMEKGLTTEITVTAEQIRLDADKKFETKIDAGTQYTNLSGSIALEAGRITSEIDRATKAEQTLSGQIVNTTSALTSKIEQTEKDIELSVSQSIQETKTYASTQATNAQNAANSATDQKLKSYSTTTQMNSAIKLAADSITSNVSATYETKTNAGTQYESLSTSITQTAAQISQKVSKGSVSSEISQEAGKIAITSDRFSLQSTNCSISEDGTIKAVNCELSGTLKTVNIQNDGIIIDQYGMILLGNGGIRYSRDGVSNWTLITASGSDVTVNSLGTLDLKGQNINIGVASYRANSVSVRTDRFGIFGTTPASKQTVSTISSPTSATASVIASKVNEIINALKKYGLL